VIVRPFFYVLCVAFVVWLVWAVRAPGGEPSPTETSGPEPTPAPPPTTTVKVERRVQGKNAVQWHHVAQRYLSRKRSLQQAIHFDPEVDNAINLACVIYGNCSSLWSKARCESHLWRYAHNPSGASGLFQFLPSTWGSTPFRAFSIYDPYANAMAAGWMHRAGRGNEWVCR
jgi:hypothetical protein